MSAIAHQTLEQIVQRIDAGNTLVHAGTLRGGASAEVILLEVRYTGGETRKYLLRVHSAIDRNRNPDVARDEFALLKALHDDGLPVAHPVYLDESCEVYPIPYLVVAYLDGATEFSPRNLPDFLRQSAGLLAKIHQAKQSLPALDFLSDRAKHVQWWLDFQPKQLDEQLDEGRLRTVLETFFPLKQANESTLLHSDFWPGNLIWRDGQLVGVIDWEDAEIGDPLSDLGIARLEMLWAFGREAMRDFTQAYQTLMPHLDYGNLPYWDLFSALRPANQLADWATTWPEIGRPDITLASLMQAHRWFVNQAFEQIG